MGRVIMIFVVGFVARGCREAIGCHAARRSSLNFDHAQEKLLSPSLFPAEPVLSLWQHNVDAEHNLSNNNWHGIGC